MYIFYSIKIFYYLFEYFDDIKKMLIQWFWVDVTKDVTKAPRSLEMVYLIYKINYFI